MELHKDFPNISNALLIIAIMIGIEILLAILAYAMGLHTLVGGAGFSAIIIVLSNGIILSLLMSYKKLSYSQLFHQSNSSIASMVLLLTIPLLITIAGGVFWVSEITSIILMYFPMDEYDSAFFTNMMGGGLITVITVCIIAPFVEEMLFRGIILRGFLANYGVAKAVFMSSILFSLAHLNIYQIPTAFAMGCLLGWLYVHTKSLWPCIFAHALNNILATISFTELATPSEEFYSTPVITVSILTTLFGLALLRYIFKLADSYSGRRPE